MQKRENVIHLRSHSAPAISTDACASMLHMQRSIAMGAPPGPGPPEALDPGPDSGLRRLRACAAPASRPLKFCATRPRYIFNYIGSTYEHNDHCAEPLLLLRNSGSVQGLDMSFMVTLSCPRCQHFCSATRCIMQSVSKYRNVLNVCISVAPNLQCILKCTAGGKLAV